MLHIHSEPMHEVAGDPVAERSIPALRAQDLSWVIDEIDYGIVVVDIEGTPRFANRCAQDLLAGGRSLRVSSGRVQVASEHQPLLRDALVRAGQGLRSMLVLEDDLGLAVLPWQSRQRPVPERPLAVLVLGRSRLSERLTLQWFARCHRLTPAESSLLERLCEGDTPSAAARAMGVAISTVRTHISAIRAKTAASSVGHLLCRIARQPPMRSALRPPVAE